MPTRKITSRKLAGRNTAAQPAERLDTFPAWKERVLAGLDKITASTVRERDLKQLYVKGATPEDAARDVEMLSFNASRASDRAKRK